MALSTVAVLGVGCSTSEPTATPENSAAPDSSSSASAVGPIPSGLETFYTQTLEWESCDRYNTDGSELGSAVECAMVTVPLDYADPTGTTIEVAISRTKATGEKIGSILMNPGGPGSSGLYLAGQAAGTAVADRFDRIGFDPRGIGASEPEVRCLTSEEIDEERREPDVDVSPEGIAATEAEHRDYAAQCVERTGADVLEHVGTREVVRDMDVIRAVLGDEKLTYIATPTAPGSGPRTPRNSRPTFARWCSTVRSIPTSHPSTRRSPRERRSRPHSISSLRTAHRPRPARSEPIRRRPSSSSDRWWNR